MHRSLPGAALAALVVIAPLRSQARELAITVDDLPWVPSSAPVAEQVRLTDALLAAFKNAGVPAIGFVNEGRLGTPEQEQARILPRWLDAGLELGNHTRTHPDLHRMTLAEFEREIVEGEKVTRALLARRGKAPRYFRHPFLHTGRSVAVRDSLEAFLRERGYAVAPVTMDNYDYVFARAFQLARERGDASLAGRIRSAYLAYMDSVVTYWEAQAEAILGRPIPHVLLLHANALNATTFPALAARLKARGYRFVSLERALTDPAYRLPDRYAGPAGISWLHRWAITRGTPSSVYAGEPVVPKWVEEAAGLGG